MSDYIINANGVGAPGPSTQTDSVPKWPIGYTALGVDRAASTAGGNCVGEFVYVRGSNVASQGQWVAISNGSAVLIGTANSNTGNMVGCACGPLSATNRYGWVQIAGRVDYGKGTSGATNLAFTVGNPVYVVAGTAGYIQGVSIAGNRVMGIHVLSSRASDATTPIVADLNRPFLFQGTGAI